MADVDPGDVLRVGAGLSFQGVYDVVNVFHILTDMPSGRSWTQVTGFIQDWLEEVYDNLKATLNDTMGTNAVSVANVTQDTTLGAIAWSPTWAGAETGECTAPGVCCFSWGRTYKPRVQLRKYWGVFGDTNVVNGIWTSAVQSACDAAMGDVIAEQLMATDIYFTGVAYNRALATYEKGVSVASAAEPAYQRRRKRGRGS